MKQLEKVDKAKKMNVVYNKWYRITHFLNLQAGIFLKSDEHVIVYEQRRIN